MRFNPGLVVLGVSAILVVSGCGGGAGSNESSLTGTVTLDGQPLTKGSIAFVTADGNDVFSAPIGEDGSYSVNQSASMNGVPTGSYKVTVVATEGGDGMDEEGNPVPETSLIPEKYNDPDASGLTADIKAGANDVPIELSKE